MDPVDRARSLADDLLFPRALDTDAAGLVPADLLDRLAAEGFYGMAAPAGVGGWDLSAAEIQPVVEVLAERLPDDHVRVDPTPQPRPGGRRLVDTGAPRCVARAAGAR